MLYSNFESNDIFSYENQRFSPKFKFIGEDKIEFKDDDGFKMNFFIFLYFSVLMCIFVICVIAAIISKMWINIPIYLFLFIICYFSYKCISKCILRTQY